ncbi:SitI3 family protein [Solirubrobacter taibaiensis]|nr:SitI3 family protein [Solirubrobacter taibaiensis]
MALEYALIVPGGITPEAMWPRLYGERYTPPTPIIDDGLWTAEERERFGVLITLHRGEHGFYDVGDRVREPAEYLYVGFRADWEDLARADRSVRELAQNVLDSGGEDLWLSLNGEELLLERIDGEVRHEA